MDDAARFLGQALLYALFFIPIAYITQQPEHGYAGMMRQRDPGEKESCQERY